MILQVQYLAYKDPVGNYVSADAVDTLGGEYTQEFILDDKVSYFHLKQLQIWKPPFVKETENLDCVLLCRL